MFNDLPASTLASILLLASGAAAQPAQPPPAQPPASKDDAPLPPAIVVNDALLAPIPPASHVLGNWREALALMSSRSVDLAIARQEIERAAGQSRQALALALPSLVGTGQITHQFIRSTIPAQPAIRVGGTTIIPATPSQVVPDTPILQAALTLSMPILAPRIWYGIGTADLVVKSAKISTEDKRRTALISVADSIVAVFTAERVAEINRLGLRSSLERLELTQRQFRLGVGTRLDVLRAEQDAAAARATLIAGDEGLRRSREALGLALGTSDAYGVPPTLSLNEIETTIRGTCAPGTVADRADVRAAQNDLSIAKRGIRDVTLSYLPTAQLSSTLSASNQAAGTGLKDYAWQIQGVLTVPIWEGGARYGAARIARANTEESKIKLDATVRGASVEATQALRSVTVAESARAVSEASRDIAREAARLAKRAYEKGAGTSFDLVDSAQKQRAAELDLAVKEFDLVKAKIAALLATASCNY